MFGVSKDGRFMVVIRHQNRLDLHLLVRPAVHRGSTTSGTLTTRRVRSRLG